MASVAVSFGNHLTTAALVPDILVFLWKVDRKAAFDVRTLGAAIVGVAGATLSYYCLIWRAGDAMAFHLESMPRSWDDVLNIVLGGRYRGVTMFDASWSEVASDFLPYLLVVFAVVVPLAVIGLRSSRGSAVRTMLVWWAPSRCWS